MYPRAADGPGASIRALRAPMIGHAKFFVVFGSREGAQRAFLGKREGIKASIYIQNACGRVRVCV